MLHCRVPFVADMQERMRDGKPFNKYNRDTFYTQDTVSLRFVTCLHSNEILSEVLQAKSLLTSQLCCSSEMTTSTGLW